MTDSKAGLSLADVVNTVGQNRIAINLVWTLVTGYLVMFMQAGFAAVETGLCRAKNANHTYHDEFHGVRLRVVRLLGNGLRHCSKEAARPITNLGGLSPLNSEFAFNFIGGKTWGLFGSGDFSSRFRPMTSA